MEPSPLPRRHPTFQGSRYICYNSNHKHCILTLSSVKKEKMGGGSLMGHGGGLVRRVASEAPIRFPREILGVGGGKRALSPTLITSAGKICACHFAPKASKGKMVALGEPSPPPPLGSQRNTCALRGHCVPSARRPRRGDRAVMNGVREIAMAQLPFMGAFMRWDLLAKQMNDECPPAMFGSSSMGANEWVRVVNADDQAMLGTGGGLRRKARSIRSLI